MGQQQLLFLILAACIFGIAISVGVIAVQSNSNIDYRTAVYAELKRLAAEARTYRSRSYEEDGGDGSFIGLTCTPQGMEKLKAASLTPAGNFSITQSSAHSIQILAVGLSPGNDPRKPIKMLMTVFAETTSIAVLN